MIMKFFNTKMLSVIIGILLFALFSYFFIGWAKVPKKIEWGMNFSPKFSQSLGLDWQKNYLALLNDMGVKNMKIAAHWDLLEKADGEYDFSSLDFMLDELAKKNGKAIVVFGIKTTRWPECHLPRYAQSLDKAAQQERILRLLEVVVKRYKNHPALAYWQPENEALFPFGQCPWIDENFYKKEMAYVKQLDPSHPTIMADSGEGSFWFKAAQNSDIPSTTLYRKAYFEHLGIYINYPFPPVFYYRKAQLVKLFYKKEVILGELQAEPWGPKLIPLTPWEDQEKAFDFKQFKANLDFGAETGFNKIYLWGGEWMYWAKTVQNRPEFWDYAQKVINQ